MHKHHKGDHPGSMPGQFIPDTKFHLDYTTAPNPSPTSWTTFAEVDTKSGIEIWQVSGRDLPNLASATAIGLVLGSASELSSDFNEVTARNAPWTPLSEPVTLPRGCSFEGDYSYQDASGSWSVGKLAVIFELTGDSLAIASATWLDPDGNPIDPTGKNSAMVLLASSSATYDPPGYEAASRYV